MRCFVSINFPEEFQNEIEKIQDCLPEIVNKKTKSENLHLTLKFLGEIKENKLKEVNEELKKIKFRKFFAEVGEIGFFDKDFYGIVWFCLKNCEELQKQVDECLKNLFSKEKRFMAHVTLARIKNLKNKKEFLKKLSEIKIPKIKFLVSEFYLMQSTLKADGSEYRVIEKYEGKLIYILDHTNL